MTADHRWADRLMSLPGEPSRPGLAARGVALVLLALWTVAFVRHGVDGEYLCSSFLHLVHIPFHEAGHVLLSPFGRFLTVLGGSLFQVAVPVICGCVLLLKTGDAFGAAVTLWWTGQSLMDLAPYIADARSLQLVLLGGRTGAEVEGHDWEYLLETVGWLHRDVAMGRFAFAVGTGLMAAAIGWGVFVVWRHWADWAGGRSER
jgi:hypothetical protein